MKKKTINSIICKKFDEWLTSIKDENVKNLVEKNSLITGGCITSMLLQEEVNDFDVYFTNKETVLAVANYYVKEFKESSEHKHADGKTIEIKIMDGDVDSDWVSSQHGSMSLREPGRVKIYLKSSGIAGESGENDYQYFESRPDEEGESFVKNIFDNISKTDDIIFLPEPQKRMYRPIFLSANAITLSDKIQIVIRFYGEFNQIHENYDFVHCTNYWLSSTRQVELRQGALEAILAKELIYIGSKYPVCSIIRLRKFLKRGWNINAGQILKVAFQVRNFNLSDPLVLEDQLVGVDAAYFAQLVDNIKNHTEREKAEGREFTLTYGYLETIIDKMF